MAEANSALVRVEIPVLDYLIGVDVMPKVPASSLTPAVCVDIVFAEMVKLKPLLNNLGTPITIYNFERDVDEGKRKFFRNIVHVHYEGGTNDYRGGDTHIEKGWTIINPDDPVGAPSLAFDGAVDALDIYLCANGGQGALLGSRLTMATRELAIFRISKAIFEEWLAKYARPDVVMSGFLEEVRRLLLGFNRRRQERINQTDRLLREEFAPCLKRIE